MVFGLVAKAKSLQSHDIDTGADGDSGPRRFVRQAQRGGEPTSSAPDTPIELMTRFEGAGVTSPRQVV